MIKPIKVHPVKSASIILWGDDGNKEHSLIKAQNCVGSVISFDKRQIWEVYPYKRYRGDTEYCGACERKGMYIRLMPNDFKRIFGTDIVNRAERRTDGDLIDRQAAIDVLAEWHDEAITNRLNNLPSVQPGQRNARVFQGIVVEYPSISTYPEYEGKPYFSIKYTENGQGFIGYGTYKPEVLSEYLKEYFMPSALKESYKPVQKRRSRKKT